MIDIHHYNIIKYFHCLKKSSVPLLFILLPIPIPGNHLSFYCLQSFAFFGMSYSWNCIVCSLFRLDTFTQSMHLRFHHAFSWHDTLFLFSASIPFLDILFIYSSTEGYLGYFKVLAITNKAATNVCAGFCVDIFQLLWVNKYQGG